VRDGGVLEGFNDETKEKLHDRSKESIGEKSTNIGENDIIEVQRKDVKSERYPVSQELIDDILKIDL